MRVLILGAGGMIGRKLAARLATDGTLGGDAIDALDLIDIVEPPVPESPRCEISVGAADLSETGVPETVIATRPDVIFHLAAVVSGEAERDFDKGYRVNLDASRALFEAIRHAHEAEGYTPRVVFASSLAVYGAPLPDVIPDDFIRAPRTSYGTQKAIVELLLDDYTRRGFFVGVGVRLPTIVIRPGAPNAAASGFFSAILREPLSGRRAILPVDPDTRHWLASPRAAVSFLVHAAALPANALGPRRTMTMPGVETTPADQIDALRRARGDTAADLVDHEPDAAIAAIISTWPRAFATEDATRLGFEAEASVDDLIAVYLEDDDPDAPR